MKNTMRPLTYALATRCENATKPRCHCRCGGTFHGAARKDVTELAPQDPHFAERKQHNPKPTAAERLEAAGQTLLFLVSSILELQGPEPRKES